MLATLGFARRKLANGRRLPPCRRWASPAEGLPTGVRLACMGRSPQRDAPDQTLAAGEAQLRRSRTTENKTSFSPLRARRARASRRRTLEHAREERNRAGNIARV